MTACADTAKTGPCPTTGAPVAALIPGWWPRAVRRGCAARLAVGQARYGAVLRLADDRAGRAWAVGEARQELLDAAMYLTAADRRVLAGLCALLAWACYVRRGG